MLKTLKNRRYGFPLVVLLAVSLFVVSAIAVTTVGNEKIKSFEGIQIGPPDVACTNSFPSFEAMPGMSLPFVLNAAGRVLILFQGQFGEGGSTANARAVVRITVDGVALNAAGAIGNDHGSGLQTFGYNAFSEVLSAGAHTVAVAWHTAPMGEVSCVEERSLIILQP